VDSSDSHSSLTASSPSALNNPGMLEGSGTIDFRSRSRGSPSHSVKNFFTALSLGSDTRIRSTICILDVPLLRFCSARRRFLRASRAASWAPVVLSTIPIAIKDALSTTPTSANALVVMLRGSAIHVQRQGGFVWRPPCFLLWGQGDAV